MGRNLNYKLTVPDRNLHSEAPVPLSGPTASYVLLQPPLVRPTDLAPEVLCFAVSAYLQPVQSFAWCWLVMSPATQPAR
ncbi:uncharacterized protein SPSK_03740 [Sporothrix schenckii 1099-18]|uniref:Uncharacterized protein n=1 Tax=Sporothrix schenckii 1099-18 TaxID=1397361 RepID=A0A0F2M1G5_SPOSC|nr:uncharacterized protein SPSK_03740 [Sporothrix schenckii 1099-18]KJR82605.1 hypothetical protein SPSK_03740 [Sporothrix schenckii 1099-18]